MVGNGSDECVVNVVVWIWLLNATFTALLVAFGSRSRLLFIRGNMTAERYVNDVLQPNVVPYVRSIEDGIFQQDNARPHIARVSRQFLELENIRVLPWPPRSPDLSPKEKVWNWMDRNNFR